MKTNAQGERLVRCPQCGGDSVFAPSNKWRPFCSERCRQIDLGAWASESFRVPAAPPQDPDELGPEFGSEGSDPLRH